MNENRADQNKPTLLSSCARAATSAEARFRIHYPNSGARSSRVVALDAEAARIMRDVADEIWEATRFLGLDGETQAVRTENTPESLRFRTLSGDLTNLDDELSDADVVVLLATTEENGDIAGAIAREAGRRRVMCAGLALGLPGGQSVNKVVASLRRHSSVLVVSRDAEILPSMLAALRG